MTRSDPDLGSQTGSYTFQLQCKWWGVGRGRIFFLLPFTDTVLWALVWFWDVSTFKGMKLWLLHPPLNLYGFIVQLLMEFLILSQGSKEIHVQNIPDSILFYGCYVCGLSLRCKKKNKQSHSTCIMPEQHGHWQMMGQKLLLSSKSYFQWPWQTLARGWCFVTNCEGAVA